MALELREITRLLKLQHERIREDPQTLIPILRERLNKFSPEGVYYDRPGVGIKTLQGPFPIHQLIHEIMEIKGSLPSLQWSEPLHLAADDHARMIQTTGMVQPMDMLAMRVTNYSEWDGHIAESVEYCYGDPQEMIVNLLIDDGIPLRGNRKNILNPEFRFLGIGLAPHMNANLVAVFTYGTRILERTQLFQAQDMTPLYGWSCSCLLF